MTEETIIIMKDKADNLRVTRKDELTHYYKSFADYAFSKDETCQSICEHEADSVLCTPTNDEFKFTNWKCELWKCNACTSIALPVVEIDSSNRAPIIVFNTYMTPFCSCQSQHKVTIRVYIKSKHQSNAKQRK